MRLQRACAMMCAGTDASQLLSENACVSSWKSPALYLRGRPLLKSRTSTFLARVPSCAVMLHAHLQKKTVIRMHMG